MDDVSPGVDRAPSQAEAESAGDRLAHASPAGESTPSRIDPVQDTSAEGSEATILVPQTGAASHPSAAGPSPAETAEGPGTIVAPRLSGTPAALSSSVPTIIPGALSGRGGAAAAGSGVGAGSMTFAIGAVLGDRYEILELLGQGGMGTVYKVADQEVGRVVALKIIRPEMAQNPEILGRFKQELLLSSKVTHRNVIRIYDLGEAQGVKYITMEFIEGENLHHLLRQRGKLEIGEAVDIMEQVASGLAAAHREGIIHRDLKPANILLDKSGRVVVMDFGLARTFSGEGMTQTGTMMGTMEYMSPEQAQGQDVKASSDIFTVGLILYELLAGATPFHAESAVASLLMRTQRRAAPLVNIDKTIPGTLSNIVAKCLEKEPAKRYQSAEHLDADLRAWQGDSGARVSASSGRLRVDRVRELPWARIGVASALTLAVAGGGTWYRVTRRHTASFSAHGPVSVLIGDFANHTGDSVLDNTLEPMLGVAMEGASFVNVYSRGDARKLARKLPNAPDTLDEQSSRLIALNQGVNAVITGDISLRGDQYDISAIALDAVSGNVLAKADIAVTNKQQILSEIPKLAAPIRQALGDTTSPSQQFEKVSGGFTAASLEAVHQDALGVDEQFAGKFQQAFDSFQKSAQLDPKFARAYTGMAAMAQNLGRSAEAVKYIKLALANSDRMTERERYRNQGLYYLTIGDWQNCVQQYTQLVTRYPADRVGQNNLAECYTQLRDAPKALAAAEQAVKIVPKGVGQRLTLAFIESFASNFAQGEKEARAGLEISPTAAQGYLALAEAELGQGHVQQSQATYRQLEKLDARSASMATDGLADLAAYQGQYAEAKRILTQAAAADQAARLTDDAARKYAALAHVEELEGHKEPALAAAGKALAMSQSMQIEFLAGMIYADEGDAQKAEKAAAALARQPSSEPQAYSRIILGMTALGRQDAQKAIDQITAANTLLNTWIGHYELGRAYLGAQAFKEADAQLAICVRRRGEAIELFDDNVPTYSYLPAVYYYQGRALEGMQDAKFTDAYKTYLGIRGQSPDDPLVAEIRKKIGQS